MFKPRPKKRLNAATTSRHLGMDEEMYNEPQTKLSVAFIVVLILHVVAVGGIYAFNTIKANRKTAEPAALSAETPKATPATAAPVVAAAARSSATAPIPKAEAGELRTHSGSVAAVVPTAAAIAPVSGNRVHHVKAGENLAKVATLYAVSVEDLEEANGAKNVAILRPGQILNVPKQRTPGARKIEDTPKVAAAAKPPVSAKTYVVAKGDNPVSIARRLGVRSEDLLKINGIDDPKKLRIGQTLQVPENKN